MCPPGRPAAEGGGAWARAGPVVAGAWPRAGPPPGGAGTASGRGLSAARPPVCPRPPSTITTASPRPTNFSGLAGKELGSPGREMLLGASWGGGRWGAEGGGKGGGRGGGGELRLSPKRDFDLAPLSGGHRIPYIFIVTGPAPNARPARRLIYELISLISLFNHAPSNRVSLRKD